MSGLGPFFLIIVAAVILALLGLALVRRTVPHERLAQQTDVVGYVYAVIGVIYAVILAQVVIAAWQEYQDARAVADNEANAVLNLARLAQVWSDADRERVEDALSAYAAHVVDVEWPEMARNQFDESLHTVLIHDLWQAVNDAGARAEDLDPVYAASLQQLDALDEARRSRVLLGEQAAGSDDPDAYHGSDRYGRILVSLCGRGWLDPGPDDRQPGDIGRPSLAAGVSARHAV